MEPVDKNGHALKVGDVISLRYPRRDGKPDTYTITAIREGEVQVPNPEFRRLCDSGRYSETVVGMDAWDHVPGHWLSVRKSAKSRSNLTQRADSVTFVRHGKPINPESIQEAEKLRKEKAAVKPFHPTKADRICYVLMHSGGPLSKEEILRRVHVLENSQIPFRKTSNGCYFLKTKSNFGSEHKASVILAGLIQPAGKVDRKLVYTLTPKGIDVAGRFVKWFTQGVLKKKESGVQLLV